MNSKSQRYNVFLWLLCAFFYFYQFIGRISPIGMAKQFSEELHLKASEFGLVTSTWYWAYSIMQIPMGIMLDRVKPHYLFFLAAVLAGTSSLLFSLSHTLFLACIARFMLGIAASAGFIGTMKVASLLFPKEKLPVFSGITSAIGTFTPVFGSKLIADAVLYYGWRDFCSFLFYIGIVISISFPIFFWGRKFKLDQDTIIEHKLSFLKQIKNVISERNVVVLGVLGLILYAPLTALADLWGPAIISSLYEIDQIKAIGISRLMYAGFGIGALGVGFIRKLVNNVYYAFSGVCAIAFCIIFIVTVLHQFINLTVLGILLFLLGFFCSLECVVFSEAIICVQKKRIGLTLGFINTMTMLGGAILQPVIGLVLDLLWCGQMNHGMRVYGTYEYGGAIVIIEMIMVAGICIGLYWQKSFSKMPQ
ncbi:MFS transporter [Candidatus Fokinia crypta]|uniref:MFS transporter n=1 Tax=Candidatus Fokinia crypta TaxID=1920990 RepID=A0ABZ0UR52_9RICK|nr:MFS transporter [Candidatus Fokinia cryptica]WPX97623.1 MFS transporter [Candidatus Fokinia cryptica]